MGDAVTTLRALELSIVDDFMRGMSMQEIADARSMGVDEVEDVVRRRMLSRRSEDRRLRRRVHESET